MTIGAGGVLVFVIRARSIHDERSRGESIWRERSLG
jgi:hypothetical protein